jgi:predicted nucleotidyltransferase
MMRSIPVDIAELTRALPGLRLLVLHGSRARNDAHAGSDWDFAYSASPGFDELELSWRLTRALGTDSVDLVDLARAGGLLRYRVARDGELLIERERGEFERFALASILFWLDAEPILRPAYQAVLEGLG